MKIGDTVQIMSKDCFDGFEGVVDSISPCGGFSIHSGSSVLVVPMRIYGRIRRKFVLLNGSRTLIKGKK